MNKTTDFKKKIIVWMMLLLSIVFGWMFIPGDIGINEMSLSMVMVPSLVTGLVAWLVGETTERVQKIKHTNKDE